MIEILKKIPFFAQLGDEDMKAIGEKVQMQYFGSEQVIFEQGDYGEEMYVIKRGKVQVLRDFNILAVLSDNAFFGEMALVSEEPRNATIRAVTDVEALVLKKDDFRELLETKPSIASVVSYEVVKRANQLS
ncbi:cyclic nucleotide-binding domain-containing protein [Patescibacteria group bacterium]|nr:cyclic nucleotide-binding domain-containing protein [Patescibacteria group bacterium]MBU1016055.1 cyclic nucleotide-binding domain-containing protein [Patescibacteria group bacterium]MBU1684759.1 cyclic nucleotide-binding domain-containing protein [Patescibacteria group bacterium]MBU1938673.1 cyclic nucleotide-binding domain-containing protein [Patescibacteria group bacterium]